MQKAQRMMQSARTNRPARAARPRRGLTLLELLLAAAITVMVAAAIAGMLGAVSSGVDTRRDQRTVMVLSSTAHSRIGAYVGPSRCLLGHDSANLTIWLNDDRPSETVHATEIRWLTFDEEAGTISATFVQFPDEWTQAQKNLEDLEYPNNASWSTVLSYYETRGWTQTIPLVNRVQSITITRDKAAVLDTRHLVFDVTFDESVGSMVTSIPATIRRHNPPVQ